MLDHSKNPLFQQKLENQLTRVKIQPNRRAANTTPRNRISKTLQRLLKTTLSWKKQCQKKLTMKAE